MLTAHIVRWPVAQIRIPVGWTANENQSIETKCGFLSWHRDKAVLNFFDRVLGPRHSVTLFAARIPLSNNFTNA